jgi:hypothetical protein
VATCNAIDVFRGESIVLNFQIVCATSTASNPDVSTWNTCFHLKLNPTDTGYVAVKSGVITCGPGGKIAVTLDSTDTLQTNGPYYHDLWRVDAGSLAVLSIGMFHINWSVLYP